MTRDLYKDLLAGVVEELINRTDDPELHTDGEFKSGYRFALHTVLSLIEQDAKALNVLPADIGFGSFSPAEWFRLGIDYRR